MRLAPPGTVLRLDPAYPPLWRDGTVVQFGLERRVELEVTDAWHDALISRLARGIRADIFDVVAHSLGAPPVHARRYLQAMRPVLLTTPALPPRVHLDHSDGMPFATVHWTRETLKASRLLLAETADRRSVAVALVAGAAASRRFAPYMAEDRAHLPLAFDAGGATIGPLVVPGKTPCLSCRDGHETARDAAWPLLHAQLIDRDSGEISASRIVEAATIAAKLLTTTRPGGVSVRITASGSRSRRRLGFHAECQCRAMRLRSPRESGRGIVPLGPSDATMRAPESRQTA